MNHYGANIGGPQYPVHEGWTGNFVSNEWNSGNTYPSNVQNDKQMNRITQEQALIRKAAAETQHFWNLVQKNRHNQSILISRRTSKSYEEQELFQKKGEEGSEGMEKGVIDDNIPVQRSGPQSDEHGVLSAFSDLEGFIPSFAQKNIQRMKYETPTPIQKHAIPLGIAGVDLMCCAQTGSGKTFAFLLPVVTAIDKMNDEFVKNASSRSDFNVDHDSKLAINSKSSADTEIESSVGSPPYSEHVLEETELPTSSSTVAEVNEATAQMAAMKLNSVIYQDSSSQQKLMDSQLPGRVLISEKGVLPRSVIMAPTRELAVQIHLDARRLIYGSIIKAVCVYGGNDVKIQLSELSVGCDIIVATPGRLNDLVDRGVISLSEVCFLVLDEADRMLDMGFEPQIRRIVLENDMPAKESRQTFLFSATFPVPIQTLAKEFLREYVWIGVGRVGSTVDNIKQQILSATSDPYDKMRLLIPCLDQTTGRTLIFVQKKKTASWLCECLNKQYRITAEEIHGDRTQTQRENALKQFREGNVRILVATDVAARGLDVPAVTHVIQFDLPLSSEDFDVYVHRIGRTGRAGMTGLATAFYVPGREAGEGNGKIAAQMLELLKENNQVIPDWFTTLDDLNPGFGGGKNLQRGYSNAGSKGGGRQSSDSTGYGGYNAGGGYKQQQAFGWRDARSDQQTVVYGAPGSASAFPYNQRFQSRSMDGAPSAYGTAVNPNTIRYAPQPRAHMSAYNVYNNPVPVQSYGQYSMQPGMHDSGVPPGGPIYDSVSSQGMMPNQYYDPYNRTYVHSGGHNMAGAGMMDSMQGQWQMTHANPGSGSPPTPMNPMTPNYGSMSSSSSSPESAAAKAPPVISSSGKVHGDPSIGIRSSGQRGGGGGVGGPNNNRPAMYGPAVPMSYPQHQPHMMPGPDMSMGMPIPPPLVFQPQSAYYPPSVASASTPMSTQMHMTMDYNPAHNNMYTPQGGRGGNRNQGARYDQGRRFNNPPDDHREWK